MARFEWLKRLIGLPPEKLTQKEKEAADTLYDAIKTLDGIEEGRTTAEAEILKHINNRYIEADTREYLVKNLICVPLKGMARLHSTRGGEKIYKEAAYPHFFRYCPGGNIAFEVKISAGKLLKDPGCENNFYLENGVLQINDRDTVIEIEVDAASILIDPHFDGLKEFVELIDSIRAIQ